MAEEIKKEIETSADLLKELNEIKSGLEIQMESKAQGLVEAESAKVQEKLDETNKAIEELKAVKPEVTKEELKAISDNLKIAEKSIDRISIAIKSGKSNSKAEVKTFNEALVETIESHKEEIQNFKKGAGELKYELKAVGDMTVANNFPGAGPFTQDVRNTFISLPYNRVWLGDVLPGGQMTGTSILYPKEAGGEGGAALWTDKTTDKPEMDFDFTSQTAFAKWIAGYVVIDRDMLDDIAFLQSYITARMLISLKIAENNFILNGSADTNPVTGMLTAATAYDGTYDSAVDRIIDAAWGQLIEDTFEFYNPTNLILTPRNAVQIALNKATGSGEYDLPNGTMAIPANNPSLLQVGNLGLVQTTQIGSGNFLVFDKKAIMFIKRLQPELRIFEDATLAKRNKIMFRVEERATLAIFNNSAIIKGTITLGS